MPSVTYKYDILRTQSLASSTGNSWLQRSESHPTYPTDQLLLETAPGDSDTGDPWVRLRITNLDSTQRKAQKITKYRQEEEQKERGIRLGKSLQNVMLYPGRWAWGRGNV